MMADKLLNIPWGTSRIHFSPAHFDQNKVEKVAKRVPPNFNTPPGDEVALAWGNGDTFAVTKGAVRQQFTHCAEDEEAEIEGILQKVAAFWAKLYPQAKS
jgi:hypothetical protein